MDDRAILELLQAMVRAPSYPGVPRQEEATVLALASWLGANGIAGEREEVRGGRPNLYATIEGRRPGRHLVLCGHTDTVGPSEGSAAELFSAAVENGRVSGRGTVDMKGALAAMAGAMAAIRASGGLEAGRLTLAAVIDEEMESLGALAFTRRGIKADGAIVGEATSNRVAVGHKGLEWIAARFIGRAAHGGTPAAGINAIAAAAHFMSLVESELVPGFERRRDPILGLPAINMGRIEGGQQASIVAANCRVQFDRRLVTTETVDQMLGDLEALLAKVRAARPGLKTELVRMPEGQVIMPHSPLVIDPGHPLVLSAQASLAAEGAPGPVTTFPAWTDGALLSEAGIPTLIWGPGDLALAHSAEESVAVDEILMAARLYADTARRFTLPD